MLETRDLSCARGDRPLFRALGFRLSQGELLHLQGANGAGKTTLLRALAGLTRPAEGTIHWQGQPIQHDLAAYRGTLAYVGHLNGLHGDLTAAENMAYDIGVAGGSPDARSIDDTLAALGLRQRAQLPVRVLSQGQRRRVALARLLTRPRQLWILDEPFTALDAASTGYFARQIADHLARGGLAVVTSHTEIPAECGDALRLRLDD